MMPHRITLEQRTGDSSLGPVYTKKEFVPAVVQIKQVIQQGANGPVVVRDGTVLVHPNIALTNEARVTFRGVTYKVVGVQPEEDGFGHIVFYRGSLLK